MSTLFQCKTCEIQWNLTWMFTLLTPQEQIDSSVDQDVGCGCKSIDYLDGCRTVSHFVYWTDSKMWNDWPCEGKKKRPFSSRSPSNPSSEQPDGHSQLQLPKSCKTKSGSGLKDDPKRIRYGASATSINYRSRSSTTTARGYHVDGLIVLLAMY